MIRPRTIRFFLSGLAAAVLIAGQAISYPLPFDTGAGKAVKTLLDADTFPPDTGPEGVAGWSVWSQRDETRPLFFTGEYPSLGGSGSLGIGGGSNSSAHGCWLRNVNGIVPGRYYRIEAFHTSEMVPWPRWQAPVRLDWRGADGGRVGQPEYVPEIGPEGKWMKVGGAFRAPEKAVSVNIELYLSFCPQGRIWWDGIKFTEIPDPGRRMVRVATVNCYPTDTPNSAASVEEFCKLVDEAGKKGADIVCLGEGINIVGVRGNPGYSEVAEPIPGPTTNRLGELARRHGMYIVAALGEREGNAVYNTAVLIDRQGRVAGRYHKVYLPREEIEAGVTPGDSYPVFDTDFGRIGMMVCWDVQYVDPARALAAQGAEIIFMPIWDGNKTLIRARAIENQVWLVDCIYGGEPSRIFNPWGEVVAEAAERPGIGIADIDLNATHPEPWLGDMRLRFLHERRADVKVSALER